MMTAEQVFEILTVFKFKLDAVLSTKDENVWDTYERAKFLTSQHVGWSAQDARVKSAEAYDAIIKYICKRLDL